MQPHATTAAAHAPGSEALVRHITDAMAAHDGSLPFEQFMELALYAPGLGYYVREHDVLGARGDFVTAPEMTALFGATLALQAAQVLRVTGGGIVELGPGTGKLAFDLLTRLAPAQWPEHYTLVERSPALAAVQRARLEALPEGLRERLRWADEVPAMRGLLIANEVLDALSVQRFEVTPEGARPLAVRIASDGFEWVRGAADADLDAWWSALLPALPVAPAPGYVSERSRSMAQALASWTAPLEQGVALFLDYGYPAHEYYHPERSDGTLVCHHGHRMHGDPLVNVGEQDLTASVDFTAAAGALKAAGMSLAGYCSQAWFLMSCGIENELQAAMAGSDPQALTDLQAVKRLMLPGEMGERIQVLAAARGFELPLLGMRLKDQRARLGRWAVAQGEG